MNGPAQKNDLIEYILRTTGAARHAQAGAPPTGPEQASEATDAILRFMDEMPGGFLIYFAGQGEEIIFANRALLRIFQCDTMEEFRALTGNSFRGLVHPDDLEAVEASIQEQIASSQYDLDYVEYRIRRKDGAIRWIEDYGHFVRTEAAGDIFYVFLGDATEKQERQRQERALLLQEKDQKLQAVIEEYDKERSLINQAYLRQLEVIEGLSINYDSISYVDLSQDQILAYRLSARNRDPFKDCQALPYSAYIQSYVSDWVYLDDREMVARMLSPDYIRQKLSSGRTYYFNYRALAEDQTQYLQLRVVNVGSQDNADQVVLGCRRIDEEFQRQMEQQSLMAEALAKANLAIISKNTFLSNMSHDMRTPLHAIFGFTSLAKLKLEDPNEVTNCLDQVETASHKLLDMISRVLEMASLSDASAVEEVACDLRETAGEIYDFLQPQAQEKDIGLSLDCGGLYHSAVYADREKLRQLILYLVNNAMAYTGPGGQVTISITEGEQLPNQRGVYRLVVRDTGGGISPDLVERIFEPFSREKSSAFSRIPGAGLGLTIAKNIVDLIGGTIQVQSEVNKGSTFTVELRLRVQFGSGDAPRPSSRPDGAAQRILLVEDNEINREIGMELLSRSGFIVTPAENGKEAVEAVSRSAPGWYDLILMDLQMPVMDGWQAAAAIRALPDRALADIPIIALSANMLKSDQRKSKDSGINAHLLKPMDLPLLLRTIEELTGKKRPADRSDQEK